MGETAGMLALSFLITLVATVIVLAVLVAVEAMIQHGAFVYVPMLVFVCTWLIIFDTLRRGLS